VNDAFEILIAILNQRKLIGSATYIKGGTKCVCFTEAPLDALARGFGGDFGAGRYSGFGIQFRKTDIFDAGGRPVIYQADSEFSLLDQSINWRHVRYEPRSARPIDFTWEREWRVPSDELRFSEREIAVVLPNAKAEKKFIERVERDSYYDALGWSNVIGDLAWADFQLNPWRILRPRFSGQRRVRQ
jgi:hypothetical protein